MKSVLIIASILAFAHCAYASDCLAIPEYNTTFVPACEGTDINYLWPNYENFTQYYRCQGAGNPKLVDCDTDTYFVYVLQTCKSCDRYLPAVDCESLKTVNPPKCVPIGSTVTDAPSTETPATETPATATPATETPVPETPATETPATETPATEAPATEAPATEVPSPEIPTEAPVTPPTEAPSNGVPSPPSPATSAPDVPTPPTAGPTPPTVPNNPPTQAPSTS